MTQPTTMTAPARWHVTIADPADDVDCVVIVLVERHDAGDGAGWARYFVDAGDIGELCDWTGWAYEDATDVVIRATMGEEPDEEETAEGAPVTVTAECVDDPRPPITVRESPAVADEARRMFAEVADALTDNADRFTCSEAESLAGMMLTLGLGAIAASFIEAHAADDGDRVERLTCVGHVRGDAARRLGRG